jgi:hypothetical protein
MRNKVTHFGQKIISSAERHPLMTIGIVVLLTLGPFLNKAIHIDDTMYIWAAEHILKHPANFYGFNVNWTGETLPMSVEMRNPPTLSYLLAGVMTVFGERETALHTVMMFVAWTAAAGIFQLARLWCERPLLATLIAMSTPTFLVSATTLMCDVPMFAFWIWAIAFWERALNSGKTTDYFFATLLAGLAVLTKYSAITLLPLLPLLGLLRKRRLGWWLLWLLVPLVIIELYELATAKLYGQGLIAAAQGFAAKTRFSDTGGWLNKIIIGLAFFGGCLLPALFFPGRLWKKRELFLGGAVVLTAAAVITFARGLGCKYGLLFQLQMVVMVASGIHLTLLVLAELWRRHDTISLMLAAWLGSGFIFATTLNWTVSARSFLPLAPVASILIVRAIKQIPIAATRTKIHFLGPLGFSFTISLIVATADYSLANSARDAAYALAARPAVSPEHLWFQGHWGFQYYYGKTRAQMVDFSQSVLAPADILIMPANNSDLSTPGQNDVETTATLEFPTIAWLSTVNIRTGAGFYGAGGLLPYVFGPVPVEKYSIYRVLRPMNPQYFFVCKILNATATPPEKLNNLAWQLATSPDPNIREGGEAVSLAERACELTGYREMVMVGTLAAAYAEAGRFDEAIVTAEKACALATAANKPELLKINQQLLELYRQHLPFHEANKPE